MQHGEQDPRAGSLHKGERRIQSRDQELGERKEGSDRQKESEKILKEGKVPPRDIRHDYENRWVSALEMKLCALPFWVSVFRTYFRTEMFRQLNSLIYSKGRGYM